MNESKLLILKTAFRLFLQKSFREVTLKEIVQETGLSKGAFYHYFESKEKLFTEVVETFYFEKMLVDYDQLSKNSLRDFYQDYVKYIEKLLNEVAEFFSNSDSDVNINYLHIMMDALRLFPGFRDKVTLLKKRELKAWTEITSQARAKGEFSSPMTDEQIARIFLYSNDGIGFDLLFENRLGEASNEMLTMWDNFYKELAE